MYLPAGSFLPLTMKSNGMFASRFPIKPANPAIDMAAMTLSVMAAFRICLFIVYSIRFLRQPRFRFAACVYWLWKCYCGFPSPDCLRLCIGHTSFQRPRQKPSRMEFYSNFLPKDGLFLGRLSWEYRRAESATAVSLSDKIVRLSDQLVFNQRPKMNPRLVALTGPLKGQVNIHPNYLHRLIRNLNLKPLLK